VEVGETVDARKKRLGREETRTLAGQAHRVIVARGKKMVAFDMKREPPDEETLLRHMLGPTGNLRAPTVRVGDVLVVGFHLETYQQLLGCSQRRPARG